MVRRGMILIMCLGVLFACNKAASPAVDLSKVQIRDIVQDDAKLKQVLEEKGVKGTMQLLIDQSGGGSIYDCHQESHKIGRVAYQVYKEAAFGECDSSCHSGCYHGAMESFLNEKGTENLAKNVESVCSAFKTSFAEFECLHGVGHGTLAYMDYDMPEALTECKKLSSTFAQSSCYGGVFMENVLTGQGLGAGDGDHSTTWVNQTDPQFPCDKIDADYEVQYQCYQMQTSWMLTLRKYNFDAVVQDCLAAPENLRSVCFKSFGRDAAGNSLRDVQKTLAICDKVPRKSDYYNQCVTGAVNVIIDFWGPNLKDQATEFCKAAPNEGKQVCYQTLAGRLPDIFADNENQKAICSKFEAAFTSLCATSRP